MLFDLFVIACILIGALLGAWKGMIWQLAGIGSLFFGFVLGMPLSGWIAGGFENPDVFERFLVFAICYAAISLACYGVALMLRKKLEQAKLQKYDRHMGAFLGVVNGLAFAAVTTMFLVILVESARKPVLTRPTGKLIGKTLDGLHGVLPEGVHDVLHPYMHPHEPPHAPSEPSESPDDSPETPEPHPHEGGEEHEH